MLVMHEDDDDPMWCVSCPFPPPQAEMSGTSQELRLGSVTARMGGWGGDIYNSPSKNFVINLRRGAVSNIPMSLSRS